MVGSYVSSPEPQIKRRRGTHAARHPPLERRALSPGVRLDTMLMRAQTMSWWASTLTPPCSCSISWRCFTRKLLRCTLPGSVPPLSFGTRPGVQCCKEWRDFAATADPLFAHRPLLSCSAVCSYPIFRFSPLFSGSSHSSASSSLC